MDPAMLRAAMDRLHLRAPSTHVGYELMAKDFAAVVKMVKTLGADTIVLPWLAEEQRTEAGFGAVIAGLKGRSEERSGGNAGVRTVCCRWVATYIKKTKTNTH